MAKITINQNQRSVFPKILIMIFFLLLIVLGLIIGNLRIYNKRQAANSKEKSLRQQINEFRDQERLLQSRIEQGSDVVYLEQIARENLNLRKEGEQVVAFPSLPIENASSIIPLDNPKGFWKRISDWLRDDARE